VGGAAWLHAIAGWIQPGNSVWENGSMSTVRIKTEEKLVARMQLKIPTLPNFISTVEGSSIPIKDIPDTTLRKIGEQWTEKLIKHARSRKGVNDP
jgi:hypothetical protein